MMNNILERINFSRILKILIFAVYPAGLMGMWIFGFEVGSIHMFPYRILIPLIWLLLIFMAIRNKGRLEIPPIQVKAYGLFMLLWLVYGVLSINWAVDKIMAAKHVIFLFTSFSLICFTVVYLNSIGDLSLISKIWLVFLGLMIIIGVFETISGSHLPLSGLYNPDRVRLIYAPTAVFYNQNDFATFLSLSAPFLISYLIFTKETKYKFGLLFTLFALIYVLIATSSRANYLALILEIGFFLILYFYLKTDKKELIFIVAAALMLYIIFPDIVMDLAQDLVADLSSLQTTLSIQSGTMGIRLNLLRNGFSFLLSTWGFGVGAGNIETWMLTKAIFDTSNITNIHNWFFEVLFNYGIFIFVGYLIFYFSMIYKIYLVLRLNLQDHKMKVFGVGILGTMIGFASASMSSSSIIAFRPHWMIFALGLSYINIGLNRGHHKVEENHKSKKEMDSV